MGDAAKTCATQYWPKGVAACGTEISAMAPGNMETLGAVVECFDDRLEKENAQRCLDECTKIMEAGTDMKAAHKCYNKVLLGNVVSECIEEKNVSTADPDSLNSVVECGVENVFEWLEEKNPKAAKMLGGFLKKLGGDGDDDDE